MPRTRWTTWRLGGWDCAKQVDHHRIGDRRHGYKDKEDATWPVVLGRPDSFPPTLGQLPAVPQQRPAKLRYRFIW